MIRRKRPSRVPGLRSKSTLYVLPPIPDDAPAELKDGLAIRNACAVEGRCPTCGVAPEVIADPELAGLHHADDCRATLDPPGWTRAWRSRLA